MGIHHLSQWSLSPKNNSIELYASSEKALLPHSQALIFIGGVHGDEPEGVELAVKTLEWLKTQNASDLIKAWILIPCLNVDGYKATQRVNGNGVDLNRNYPSSNWQPDFESPRYYPGPHAGSEPEIQSLIKLIERVRPRLLLHAHSWNPGIIVSGPQDLPEARALAESSGYPIQDNIGYPTPGSLSEYAWKDRNIPVICIEEQEHIDLSRVWPHFAEGIRQIFTGCRKMNS